MHLLDALLVGWDQRVLLKLTLNLLIHNIVSGQFADHLSETKRRPLSHQTIRHTVALLGTLSLCKRIPLCDCNLRVALGFGIVWVHS